MLASGVLFLALVAQAALPMQTPLPQGAALAPRRARPVTAAELPTYTALLQAPIFAADRAPEHGAGTAVGPLDDVVVVGIAVSRGAAGALVKQGVGATQSVRIGGMVQGWRLVAVDPSHLTFTREGQRRVLTLDPRLASASGSAVRSSATQATAETDEDNQ